MRILFMALFVTFVTAACGSRMMSTTPHPSVSGQPQEVKDLHMRMGALVGAWYWKKSERKFWALVSRGAPLDRIQNRDLFFSAFTKPPDQVNPGFRELRAAPMERIWNRLGDAERLNPENETFAIVRMSWTHPDMLFVFYAIQGDGFATRAMQVTWVLENGTWMVWDIVEHEIPLPEEAPASSSFTYPPFRGLQ